MSLYHDYAIRIDGNSSEELVKFLTEDGGSYLVVKELEGTNPHYHAVIHTKRKLQAFRMAFRRQFPELRGNGAYSISDVRDLAKYERYMMKGDSDSVLPTVVASNGVQYTTDWIMETHAAYWEQNADMVQRRTAEMKVPEAVLQACKDAAVQWGNREKICELYIRELVRRDKPINIFALKSSVNLIQVKLCPDDRAILDLAAQCYPSS